MNEPTKRCRGCDYELTLDYFGTGVKRSDYCDVCRDERREAEPWSEQEIALLVATARRALDLWAIYVDRWTEDDLDRWRDLLTATGRDAYLSEAGLQRTAPMVKRFFAIRKKWLGRKAA